MVGLLDFLLGGGVGQPISDQERIARLRLGGEDTPAGGVEAPEPAKGGLLGILGGGQSNGQGLLSQNSAPALKPSHPGTIAKSSGGSMQPMPQTGKGGMPALLERLFGVQSDRGANYNGTVTWLQNRGYSPEASAVIAGDRDMLNRAIIGSGSPQNTSEYQQRQQALVQAGIDMNSQEGREYFLTGKLPDQNKPSTLTDDIKEYNFAVESGQFEGSFPEWQTKSVRTEDPSFGRYMDTRKELSGRPSYKRYTEAIGSYNSMVDASGRDTKAADLNLVYGLAKIMDPTSVVREGEQIMVKNTGALPDWLMGYINQINGGAGLRPDTRKSLMVEAQSRINEYRSAWDLDAQQAQELGREFGLKDNLLIPSVPGMKEFPSFDTLPQPTRPTPATPGKSRVIDGYTIEEVE